MDKINMIFSKVEEKEVPTLIEKTNANGFISYGEDNKFPEYLYNIYTKCATSKAIIDSIVDYSANFTTNSVQTNIDEIITRCIFDYVTFGGFALQINQLSDYKQIKYIDFKNLRTNKDKTEFWYSQEWGKYRVKSVQLPAYDPKEYQKSSIFYYTGLNRDGKVYPQPRYSGALLDMETSIEVSKFWNSAISNSLEASAIISFNNGTPSEEIQHEIEKKINSKFSGASNAAKTVITFADSADQAPTIQRLSEDNFDQKYQSLIETIEQRIFTAFRINPILLGYNVKTGFNKEEFCQAYQLFYITVIQPIQKVFTQVFGKLDISIDFQKLEIYEGSTGISDATI